MAVRPPPLPQHIEQPWIVFGQERATVYRFVLAKTQQEAVELAMASSNIHPSDPYIGWVPERLYAPTVVPVDAVSLGVSRGINLKRFDIDEIP